MKFEMKLLQKEFTNRFVFKESCAFYATAFLKFIDFKILPKTEKKQAC